MRSCGIRSIFQEARRLELRRRFEHLESDSARRWGRMAAPKMIAHLGDQLRLALGEIALRPPRGPLRFPPINYAVIYWLPWPKGKAKGPAEAFTTPPTSWEADKSRVLDLVEKVGALDPRGAWPPHPIFGRISGRAWGVLSYRHIDHHLRQFGC